MVIAFQQKKKKRLFYHQRIKKSCVIGEVKVKVKIFATTINQYKYQLTVARVIKNKIQYFIEIIFLPSIKKLKFSLFLYNFK